MFIFKKFHCRQLITSLLALAMLFSLAPVSQANQHLQWQNPNYIFKAFLEIALKNEYRKTKGKILKWEAPIHYKFKYHQLAKNELVEKLFNIHLLHLQEITNHSINETKEKANLIIHLTKDSYYDRVINNETRSDINNIASESHCMGSFETNGKGEIIKADIVLPLDHIFSKGLLVACIVEETTQVMGLPNDSDWIHPSIANDRSKVELLTGLDYLLLKILYSNKLKAGLSPAQSHDVIKDIIKQQKNSGVIMQAPFTVNQKGLNHYINH